MIRTTLTTATQQRNPQGNSQRETPPISIKTRPITPIIDTARMFTTRMRRISAILIMSVLVILISACEGGIRNNSVGGDVSPEVNKRKLDSISVSNLRVIPDDTNATLMWNNPDADIANINISYKLSTADIFGTPTPITDDARIAANATDVRKIILEGSLTPNTNYTFRVTLELKGADKNRAVIAREITRLIGPNLDGDDYADADPLETDEDGDGIDDERDAFPRNATLYAFAVSNLRVTPDESNATLIWNNPDADIANINISYKISTADNFGTPITITNDTRIARNETDVMGMIGEGSLTSNTSYTFRVTLELKGADENKSVIAREITRLIGPNLDGDDYADDDPLETDEDGDGIDDERDAFPRNATLYAFAVSNLRIIPDENNATLRWNNPDADIASINISYKLSTDDIFGTPMPITDNAKITANAIDVMEMITPLTSNTSYTFRVTLELKGADENKSVMAREITRLTGPNLDGDEYTDGNPLETDEDGDGIGTLPRNPTLSTYAVSNLRVIPDESNATLIWNNPDADIASINISYKLSTADIFGTPIPITDDARIARNETDVMGMILEGSLTPNTNYTFRVTLELKGADENKSVMAREITRLIGPNLDGDDYADDDPLETDEDGDGIDDELDKFPRNPTLYAFAVSNLRVIPAENNATLIWYNPDADIANINISYKLSTADIFGTPILITENARIAANATDVMEIITLLTSNTNYTFRVTLELEGADKNKSVMAREITRLIGPNLDGDDYADDDPLETDEDGDDTNDDIDAFPRNPTLYAFAVSNLRVIPDESNATLRWNNPDADIANINISYKLSTDDIFGTPTPITDNARITANATDVMEMITPLTPNTNYTFRVTLELKGADENKSVMAREITRLIGPNLDGDDYADDDPLETDEDGDGIDDERDAFPRNPTSSAFAVTNLRVIPDESNATLIWNNPDADIANINISYKLSTDDIFGTPIPITDDARIARNETDVMGMILEGSLTPNTNYTFRVTLELKGADKNKSVMAREITRLIGPNLDGDDYADDDPLETDEDGDDTNDDIDAFPRNPTLYAFAVSNLRIIPDENNATLRWNNPDADIANINISYKLSTADIFGTPIPITDDARIAANATDVMEMITPLTSNTNYTFRVTLELEGADKNKSVMAREITRLIGPNLDGDDYADDDPLETDEDGDGIDDERDAFPRNPTLYAFAVSNLRVIPDENNATLIWNNPDADIANINISYKLSTADDFESSIPITDDARIARNETDVMGMILEGSLTPNTNYTFRVTLELKGADENKSVMAREITRLIGPNLDGDDYADDDPLETDEDGDDTNDDIDAFPRNPTLYAFAVSNLRVIPAENNATLIWYNPDADIANINISYKLSTADIFGTPILITENARITANATDVMEVITLLTSNTNYTFRVTLELEGADKNKSVMAREITRLIGPNLDGDDYADDDPLETDEDGDDTNDDIDAFPRNPTLYAFAVSNLRVIPDESNATLIWNNPDADIANINISYKLSTADIFGTPIPITDDARIARNETDVMGMIREGSLTPNTYYTFRVTLELKGADENKSVMAAEITRLIGPNLDGDDYADDDPLETDEDGDGIDDEEDKFPRNPTLYAFAVSNLRVIPAENNATLIWNNPDADIANINISYKLSTADTFGTPIRITDNARVARNATDVMEIITPLTPNRYYTFRVTLELEGADKNKTVMAREITRLIGPNLDGDDYADDDPLETDEDGDGIDNFIDVDVDGDGLIEIATAQQLNQSRHNLLGTSFKSSAGGVGNANGCGNGGSVTACNGYELIADIYLTTYTNWQPIGGCTTSASDCSPKNKLFNAIFDGNNHTINDLTITNHDGSYANAAGLFGAISSTSILRNIHIRSGNLIGGGTNVGLLVGYARGAMIINSSAEGAVDASGNNVGGLVGDGRVATITSSYAAGGAVRGAGINVGGLVGDGVFATIISSYAAGGAVSGGDGVGGLVGDGRVATITSSYAAGGAVNGTKWVGGLVGVGQNVTITSSYAAGGTVNGTIDVGGLVGSGTGLTITSSYAAGGDVSGGLRVGGLVGAVWDSHITYSYAAGGAVSGNDNVVGGTGHVVGGLIGLGVGSRISSSYAAGGAVSGNSNVGGLVGQGEGSTITSSYAAGEDVSGDNNVGGLVGFGLDYRIMSSYAAGGDVSGDKHVGGLVGVGSSLTITSSYAAGGTVSGDKHVGGLVGIGTSTITFSYGDISKSRQGSGGSGRTKTTSELITPTDASGIYTTWASDTCADGTTLAWDFGTIDEYPALNCTLNGFLPQLRQR